MIGIAIRFDLGRYHANPWGAHVNEGLVEWPPSPWRILRGLYAVSRTSSELTDARDATDDVLSRLLTCDPPSYSLPVSTQAHTRHFMPDRSWSPARSGGTDLVIDSFRAIAPGDELIAWWPVELERGQRAQLERLVCALGHLGRSESVCSARLADGGDPEQLAAAPASEQSSGELVELLCPTGETRLEDIAITITELRRRRLARPPATQVVPYELRLPEPPAPTISHPLPRPQLALLRVHGADRPGIVEAVAVAQSLRSALQGRFGSARDGAASATFSGREGDQPRAHQHQHAHYLVLPGRDGRRIERLAVWAPEGFAEWEVEALSSLREMRMRGLAASLRVALAALERTDEVVLPELLGPARHWRSLTPFGLVRHPKVRGGALRDGPEDQIRLELQRRGMSEPASVSLVRGSWHRFRSSRVGTSRLQRAQVFGAQLTFDRPVDGPIVLGALCHFGLGLFSADV